MLIMGLAAIFIALALSVTTVVVIGAERGQSAGMVDLVRRFGPTHETAHSGADPFGDRVVKPLTQLLIRLARKLSGRDVTGTLQRRLDLAGNPVRWTVERL